ncbi:MAG: 2-pyrone-4,6-dicarboxylate hydrolase [Burkholderiaceae bacterium]|jgi:predicted TIM-barrel fold metal-dependent hydrolase|nr:MAG: 2-pyrone-4,6-dicarboxylate hydrolase [Burkholderiaceae bacterium]
MSGTPARVFDAHFHIIDPRYPLIPNNGYRPPAFTCDDYRQRIRGLPLAGGVVVAGSFQGFDQTWLIAALRQLGPTFVGVAQIPHTASDAEILELNRAGVRAVRFNLKRGGSEAIEHLDRLARRVHELAGWHAELYVDSRDLHVLYDALAALPAVSIDHLGLSRDGFSTLLKLAEHGVHVKATGFGRVDFDVRQALKDVFAANPEALMFGTDLPSTRAPRPYQDGDRLLVTEALGEAAAARVLCDNALCFYGMAA